MAFLPFSRTLKLGSHGIDVSAAKRATYRLLGNRKKWDGYLAQSGPERRTFGPFYRRDLILAQRLLTAGRVEGQFDEPTLRAFESHFAFDDTAKRLWLAGQPQPKPVFIQPNQGFVSLVEDLWRPYTIGREMALSDLGTYNPASVLPGSGAASDHATSRLDGRICEPVCAFDMGFTPATGFAHPTARRFFEQMVGRKEVHYAILGNRIWSTEKGLHVYSSGGHEGHCHVSGWRR